MFEKTLILSVIFFNITLYAKEEYQIVELAPPIEHYGITQEHLNNSEGEISTAIDLSENGIALFHYPGFGPYIKTFIYENTKGFHMIPDSEGRSIEGYQINDDGKITGLIRRGVEGGAIFNYNVSLGILKEISRSELLKTGMFDYLGEDVFLTAALDNENILGYAYGSMNGDRKFIHFLYNSLTNNFDFNSPIVEGKIIQINKNGDVLLEDRIYTHDKKQIQIVFPPEYDTIVTMGLNDQGTVFGRAFDNKNDAWVSFLWNSENEIQLISHNEYTAINNASQLIGENGVFYEKEVGLIHLNGQNEMLSVHPLYINDHGTVVGMKSLTKDNSRDEVSDSAFIWDRNKGMRDLNELIPSNSGWKLISAKKINNEGYIIGMGILHSGAERAYLLTPKD